LPVIVISKDKDGLAEKDKSESEEELEDLIQKKK